MENKESMLSLYKKMVRIRRFEEKAAHFYAAGKIPGFVHLYIGEEAIAVGVCTNLHNDDFITSTHRGHGHLIAKGGDIRYMMAELFAKKDGYCKGKGGSMHICDLSLGILGSNGIVGAGTAHRGGRGFCLQIEGQRAGVRLLLRGRRVQPGHLPREPEPGLCLEAAGHLCVRRTTFTAYPVPSGS